MSFQTEAEVADFLLIEGAQILAQDPLVLLDEGAFEVALKHALLARGHTFREGGHGTGVDRLVSLEDRRLIIRNVKRRRPAHGNPDIMVEGPSGPLFGEIKVYGEFGAKDHLDHTLVVQDVQKVLGGDAFAAFVAVAGNLYINAQKRVLYWLPSFDAIGTGIIGSDSRIDGYALKVRSLRVASPVPGAEDRVFVAVLRGS